VSQPVVGALIESQIENKTENERPNRIRHCFPAEMVCPKATSLLEAQYIFSRMQLFTFIPAPPDAVWAHMLADFDDHSD